MDTERYAYTCQEAADFLRVSLRTINRRLADGTLPSALIAGRRLIPAEALRRLIDDNLTRRAAS